MTVNDYLARRDAEWMGQVHRALGLSVGLIQQDMRPEERRLGYNCDITYATNSSWASTTCVTTWPPTSARCSASSSTGDRRGGFDPDRGAHADHSGQVERPRKVPTGCSGVEALQRAAEMGKDGIDPEGDYEVDEKQRGTLPMQAAGPSRCSACRTC